MRPRLLATAVATVQFSRIAGGVRSPLAVPARGMRGGHPARAGLSKLNSMPGCAGREPQEGRAAGVNPVRFGRRARPDGRSNGPVWAGGSAGAPYGAP
jgi:hypothetical protein